MSNTPASQWSSSKFKKFQVHDPFLQLITIKYEKKVPWQEQVKNEDTFLRFIKEVMLPELIHKATWDPEAKKGTKSLFIHPSSIKIEEFLTHDALSVAEKSEVKKILKKITPQYHQLLVEQGELKSTFREFVRSCRWEAANYIARIFNQRREESFQRWFRLMKRNFKNNIAFQYLILKPLLEQSGHNTRRDISDPEMSVLKLMHVRIEHRFYTPSVNLMKEYRNRLVFGLKGQISSGWQYFPKGKNNAASLAASAHGSGWCIAGKSMASYYLDDCSFYILRINNRPKVAIRVQSENQHIVEIQGEGNEPPDAAYYSTLWLFIKSMYKTFIMTGRAKSYVREFDYYGNKILNKEQLHPQWWQRQLDLWPGAYDFIPEEIKPKCHFNTSLILTNPIYWSLGTNFFAKYGISFSDQEYTDTFVQYPQLFNSMGDPTNQEHVDACITGLLNRFKFDDITLKEFKTFPKEIQTCDPIIELLQNTTPKNLLKGFTNQSTSFSMRLEGPVLDTILPFQENEARDLSVLRALEYILKNDCSDFSDIIFSSELTQQPDFAQIRESAWLKAVEKDPTFFFAFPYDLLKKNVWKPQTTVAEKDKSTLNKWIATIEKRPWLLQTEKKIPKSVRYHEALLRAYLRAWIVRLSKTPYRIWASLKGSYGSRKYMSYAALRNVHILNAIALSPSFTSKRPAFYKASVRMRNIPAFQLAMLRAICKSNIPFYSYEHLFWPQDPKTLQYPGVDPQHQLIQLFYKGMRTQFISIWKNDDVPENYYFNRIHPDQPYPVKIKFGSRIELVSDGEVKKYVIGENIPGFEFIDKDSTEAKLLLGKHEGTTISELNITIQAVY